MSSNPSLSLRGRGLWARPRGSSTSELARAISIAAEAGATHILYKVAHGATYLNGSAAAAQRIRDAGLVPFGWTWLLLDNPVGEAETVVRAFQDGYEGFIFDTEAPCSNRFDQARTLAQAVRAADVDLSRLFNCSFPNINHHRDLPYEQLNDICHGGLMPMSYGSFFAPNNPTPWEDQARTVIDSWTYGHYEVAVARWGIRPPLHPVLGPYHDEYGQVRMGPAEFQIWIDRLAARKPTFFSVFTAAVINDDLLPLIAGLPLAEVGAPDETVVRPMWVRQIEGAVLRSAPQANGTALQAVIYGTVLDTTIEATAADGSRWLKTALPNGSPAWVALDAVATGDPQPMPVPSVPLMPPPGHLTHVWTEEEVNFRSRPVVQPATLIGRLAPGTQMRVLEDPQVARAKLGVYGHWFHVEVEPDGPPGYIAAWYVTDRGPWQAVPQLDFVRVASDIGLNVRAAPNESATRLWRVPDGTVLKVLEAPALAAQKVGVPSAWVHVQTPSLHEGHVAAWLLKADVPPDTRGPVVDTAIPYGESAWLFGIHGAGAIDTDDFRHLFVDRRGWALFTEQIGHTPAHLAPNDHLRNKLWDWSKSGFGIMIRLNNGYHEAGTLPTSNRYPEFAATCARYAELYLRRPEADPRTYTWVVIIGNEQNNVREHPGGASNPVEHITPQRYARAFNLAYQAIKAVLPNATVIVGAVDPYNTYPWVLEGGRRYRPMDYFREMLDEIAELDGFALHTYTHGPVVDYITHKRVFTDPPLDPGTVNQHYYDFLAYRTFMEAIPLRWRDRPVYITESNHWVINADGSPPVGWVNQNVGWIQAAYKEIDRWNQTPHAQQIRALMIYRWQGDEWTIRDKPNVLQDFSRALQKDYRWRR